MTDLAAAWLAYQIRSGAVALELRHAGHTWNAIADELHLGTKDDAMRAAALYLASRLTHGERAGDAQAGAGTLGRPAT